ncbi:MAG: M12 family metallo-peptidase [Planctomycetota bacterium]
MNLLDAAVEILDVPASTDNGFGLDISIGGVGYALDLAPHSVRAPGYELITWNHGYTTIPAGPVTTVRGVVVGDSGSAIAGGLVQGGIRLQIIFGDGERFVIEPMTGGVQGAHVIYRNTDVVVDPRFVCGFDAQPDKDMVPGDDGAVAGGATMCAEIAIDADFNYLLEFGTVAAVEAEVNAIINTVNLQWESEVNVGFRITGIVVREDFIYTTSDASDLLCQFSNEWWANNPVPDRDLAHLFTGKDTGNTIGIATDFGQICDPEACGTFPCECGTFGPSGAYCLSRTEFDATFACSTSLVSHEMGHLFNAHHCSCPSNTMNPTISCQNTFTEQTALVITQYAEGLPCLDASCPPPPTCPGPGNCYIANGSPGCQNTACCAAVCAFEPFCCDTEWTDLCADLALNLCFSDTCPGGGDCCEPNGSPGCSDVPCCSIICSTDAFCCDNTWDAICGDAAIDLCSVCQFVACPGIGNCCTPNGTPGCDNLACCEAVCGADAFCCDSTWDVICSNSALGLCAVCQFACPGDGGDCCVANHTIGCDLTACCQLICPADPFCCETAWDQICANAAVAQCEACYTPCGAGEGNCCFSNGSPGCEDPECCELICELDPYCCDVTWFWTCAIDAEELCSTCEGACGYGDCCTPGHLPGCEDVACCELVCSTSPLCCETEWDASCASDAATMCGICHGNECPGNGECCDPNSTPGCADPECCTIVCDLDPFCCNNNWDVICSDAAETNCPFCQTCGGGGSGNCCGANGTPGCDDIECCEQICAADPFCCESSWDSICATTAIESCFVCNPCGGGKSAGDCCGPNGTPGCEVAECCEQVCAAEPFCCDAEWDAACGRTALLMCAVCQPACPSQNDCCLPGDSPGCNDTECCELVCSIQPFCCEVEWVPVCANIAVSNCGVCIPECPGDGCCFAPNDSPGCDDTACCAAVCDVQPLCCEVDWDQNCVDSAVEFCFDPPCPGDTNGDAFVDVVDLTNVILAWGMTGSGIGSDVAPNCAVDVADLTAVILNWGTCEGCGLPNAGLCGEPNGTPFCEDDACCETVCATTPFCCETAWDLECANEALEICSICAVCTDCSDEGEACGDDSNGGCNNRPPDFGAIACGETICGLAWANGNTRDTDWYFMTVTDACTSLTATLNAEFPGLVIIVDGACQTTLAQGDNTTPATTVVLPGSYVIIVAPANFEGAPCGTTNGYDVTLECEVCLPGAQTADASGGNVAIGTTPQ